MEQIPSTLDMQVDHGMVMKELQLIRCVYLLIHNTCNTAPDIKVMQDSMEQSMKLTVPVH